ncbi:MAG TPA: DoxX family protein [Pseudonocardiaceae bacterium]
MTQTTRTRPVTAAAQPRGANIALWGLQVVTAAVFVMAAFPKLTADPQAVAGFNAIGLGQVGMYVIGSLEIAGAIALLIPLLSGLAGLAFVSLMIGAVVTTLLVFGAEMVAMPAVVLLLAAIIAWTRRRHTAQLIALIRN